jgi:hypothetical protein
VIRGLYARARVWCPLMHTSMSCPHEATEPDKTFLKEADRLASGVM